VGQTVAKGEKITTPELNPFKAAKERAEKDRAEKQANFEANRLDAIMQNIERYDGTSNGQKDVPRG
jgi:hypothetical protein